MRKKGEYVHILVIACGRHNNAHGQDLNTTSVPLQPAALRGMVLAVRSLVQSDVERQLTVQCMQAAQGSVATNPDGTLQRIVAHFQRLFDVPYVHTTETPVKSKLPNNPTQPSNHTPSHMSYTQFHGGCDPLHEPPAHGVEHPHQHAAHAGTSAGHG